MLPPAKDLAIILSYLDRSTDVNPSKWNSDIIQKYIFICEPVKELALDKAPIISFDDIMF